MGSKPTKEHLACVECGNDTFIDVHVIETSGKTVTFAVKLACEKCKAQRVVLP